MVPRVENSVRKTHKYCKLGENPVKRYVNLYEQICGMDNLIVAHHNASTGKGWYQEVKTVNDNPQEYLQILQGMLENKTHETSDYDIFLR